MSFLHLCTMRPNGQQASIETRHTQGTELSICMKMTVHQETKGKIKRRNLVETEVLVMYLQCRHFSNFAVTSTDYC